MGSQLHQRLLDNLINPSYMAVVVSNVFRKAKGNKGTHPQNTHGFGTTLESDTDRSKKKVPVVLWAKTWDGTPYNYYLDYDGINQSTNG